MEIAADRVDETTVYYRYFSAYNKSGKPRANATVRLGSFWKADATEGPPGRYQIATPTDVTGMGRPAHFVINVEKAGDNSDGDDDEETDSDGDRTLSGGSIEIADAKEDETTVYYRYFSAYNKDGKPRANATVRLGSFLKADAIEGPPGRYQIATPTDVTGIGHPAHFVINVEKAKANAGFMKCCEMAAVSGGILDRQGIEFCYVACCFLRSKLAVGNQLTIGNRCAHLWLEAFQHYCDTIWRSQEGCRPSLLSSWLKVLCRELCIALGTNCSWTTFTGVLESMTRAIQSGSCDVAVDRDVCCRRVVSYMSDVREMTSSFPPPPKFDVFDDLLANDLSLLDKVLAFVGGALVATATEFKHAQIVSYGAFAYTEATSSLIDELFLGDTFMKDPSIFNIWTLIDSSSQRGLECRVKQSFDLLSEGLHMEVEKLMGSGGCEVFQKAKIPVTSTSERRSETLIADLHNFTSLQESASLALLETKLLRRACTEKILGKIESRLQSWDSPALCVIRREDRCCGAHTLARQLAFELVERGVVKCCILPSSSSSLLKGWDAEWPEESVVFLHCASPLDAASLTQQLKVKLVVCITPGEVCGLENVICCIPPLSECERNDVMGFRVVSLLWPDKCKHRLLFAPTHPSYVGLPLGSLRYLEGDDGTESIVYQKMDELLRESVRKDARAAGCMYWISIRQALGRGPLEVPNNASLLTLPVKAALAITTIEGRSSVAVEWAHMSFVQPVVNWLNWNCDANVALDAYLTLPGGASLDLSTMPWSTTLVEGASRVDAILDLLGSLRIAYPFVETLRKLRANAIAEDTDSDHDKRVHTDRVNGFDSPTLELFAFRLDVKANKQGLSGYSWTALMNAHADQLEALTLMGSSSANACVQHVTDLMTAAYDSCLPSQVDVRCAIGLYTETVENAHDDPMWLGVLHCRLLHLQCLHAASEACVATYRAVGRRFDAGRWNIARGAEQKDGRLRAAELRCEVQMHVRALRLLRSSLSASETCASVVRIADAVDMLTWGTPGAVGEVPLELDDILIVAKEETVGVPDMKFALSVLATELCCAVQFSTQQFSATDCAGLFEKFKHLSTMQQSKEYAAWCVRLRVFDSLITTLMLRLALLTRDTTFMDAAMSAAASYRRRQRSYHGVPYGLRKAEKMVGCCRVLSTVSKLEVRDTCDLVIPPVESSPTVCIADLT